ncbi:MAG: type II toxin-antitoxin system RelE/ParE family toxin [Lachnospiraceae bacterium]|nr:type II toxin-antitoxin system RelE/ParE family toxin [Lachnospiraceae bacterium]
MRLIEFTPESISDLQNLREYLELNFDENLANKIVRKVVDAIESLQISPKAGSDLLAKYGIVSDYLCLITNHNYVFYRLEEDSIKIIRALNEKQDFLNILFGIKTTSQETEDYWDE